MKQLTAQTKVCIVGCGPVGMTLSHLLNHFKVPNIIIERAPALQGKQ